MDLATAIDLYLDHLRVERALAANTLAAYGADLARFAGVAEARGVSSTEGLDGSLVASYLVQTARAGLSARSAARHLSTLRGLCSPRVPRASGAPPRTALGSACVSSMT